MRTYILSGLTVLALGGNLAGCGFDQSPGGANGASPCVEGQTAKCDCVGAVAVCRADGTMGVCNCSGESSGGDGTGGSAATGKGTDGKAGMGSTGGSEADGTSGTGADGTGGTEADGTGGTEADGTGGTGADGTGGTGGTDGTGGTGGTGGHGTGGDAMGGGGGTGGTKPDPVPDLSGPYGACLATRNCMTKLTCVGLNSFQPNKPGYCAPGCNPGGSAECPQPTTGDVEASCMASGPFMFSCALESCKEAVCPDGMKCVATAGTFGSTVSNCAYPSR